MKLHSAKIPMKLLCIFICLMLAASLITIFASAVEPTYNMSGQYKTSSYYDNLISLELTGDGRTDVLMVALSQLGYHEGDSDNDLDGMNKSGSRNFVEYNVLFGKLDNGEGNGTSYGYAWCAAFVNWCLREARIADKLTGGQYVSCRSWLSWFKSNGEYHARSDVSYTPQSGDLIFFKDAGSSSPSTHIGIVVYCDNGIVHTIEGNSGGVVGFHEYSLTNTYIVGYGVPAYRTVDGKAVNYNIQNNEYSLGTYIVTRGNKYMLRDYSDSTSKIVSLPVGTIIYVSDVSGKYGYTEYETLYGWYSLANTVKIDNSVKGSLVKYEANGGSFDGAASVTENTYGKAVKITYKIPAREHYTFLGWSTSASGETEYTAGSGYGLEGESTLYAVWKPESYKITFTGRNGRLIEEQTVEYGDELIPPEVDDETDEDGTYTFIGWSPEPEKTATDSAQYQALYEFCAETVPDATSSTADTTGEMTDIDTQTETDTDAYGTETSTDNKTDTTDGNTMKTAEFSSDNRTSSENTENNGCAGAVLYAPLLVFTITVPMVAKKNTEKSYKKISINKSGEKNEIIRCNNYRCWPRRD